MSADVPWRPSATVEALRIRARALRRVRAFFDDRGYLEVDTPVLGAATVTDVHLASLGVDYHDPGAPADGRLWLQTSPEYAMKRLLAAGSGPIYQIAHAFRAGERGRLHNPEFSLLEWYRPGFDHHDLMAEVTALVRELLGERPVATLTYAEAFRGALGVDPLTAADAELRAVAERECPGSDPAALTRDGLLDLLMGARVTPFLGDGVFSYVTDFPASQAALARLSDSHPRTAERFELFVDGIEIANGFHELTDAREQAARFEADRAARAARGEPSPPAPDERLLAALAAGLPDCAGVALGLDRLLMLAAGEDAIDGVVAFPVERA